MTRPAHDNDNCLRDEDLQAYVDGQIDHRRKAAVEAYLAAHPAEADRVDAYRRQIAGLQALFGAPTANDTALPPAIAVLACELDAHLHRPCTSAMPASGRRPQRRTARGLAAAVALLLAAGTAGGLALTQSVWRGDPVTVTAQPRASTSAELASGVSQAAAGVTLQPDSTALPEPDLDALGFHLIARRDISRPAGPAAKQLLYQNADNQRITLALRAGGQAGPSGFAFKRNGQAAQVLWQDSQTTFSLIGRLDQARLLGIAQAISRGLNGSAEAPQADEASPALSTRTDSAKDT